MEMWIWGVMVVMGGDVDMGCDGGDGWRCGYGVMVVMGGDAENRCDGGDAENRCDGGDGWRCGESSGGELQTTTNHNCTLTKRHLTPRLVLHSISQLETMAT